MDNKSKIQYDRLITYDLLKELLLPKVTLF
jgi:hypothetical protein